MKLKPIILKRCTAMLEMLAYLCVDSDLHVRFENREPQKLKPHPSTQTLTALISFLAPLLAHTLTENPTAPKYEATTLSPTYKFF